MLTNHKKLARLLTASLAVAAIAPATAGAVPAIDGQGVAAGGGPGVTSQTLTAPDQVNRVVTPNPDQMDDSVVGTHVDRVVTPNPDQMDGSVVGTQSNKAPQWPVNPQPIVGHTGSTATAKPSDDGIGTEAIVLIAVGGVALVAAAGLGLSRVRRDRADRQRQLA
jgi:hypothetical protein